ncbi:MAG: carboxypeptidase regulatory-like domain-containing protein, partial [Gemmatimonadales bacterium]
LPLATPSGRTIYRLLCPGVRDDATGVLLGTLREASSGRPLAGSEVRADWTVTSLTRESGFVRRPSVVRAAVDSLGRYQLCGVPTDVPVLLRSVVAGTSGAPLELRMSEHAFAVRHLSQDVGPAGAGSAVAAGRVTADGAPVAGAQVLVLGDDRIARTDEQGRYRLADLPAGSHTIEARAIGFERRRLGIELRPGDTTGADLTLARLAVTLPELNDTELAGQGGFDERRRRAVGGYFMSSEDIARFGTVRVEDLFRHVPGMRVEPVGVNDYRILSYRGQGISAVCEPTVFIDDVYIPLDPASGLALPLAPEEVHGIEVYQGPGSAPLQYRNRGEACGVILIWTRRSRR